MSSENRIIKVLMAKTALDGHWRGVYVVTVALRDAGMEVVYGGDLNPYQIVATAIQEDVTLKEMGIAEVFPPGSSLDSIVNFIKENVTPKEQIGKSQSLSVRQD